MNPLHVSSPAARPVRHGQRGVVLIFALIAMVLIMISTVALVRRVDSAQGAAGAMATKRDLMNQSDLGVVKALALFSAGALATDTLRETTSVAANYSAFTLATNASGIPTALLANDATFGVTGNTNNDIAAPGGLEIRYVIDRLCTATGAQVTGAPSTGKCAVYQRNGDTGGSSGVKKAGTTVMWVYRISVRVRDPQKKTLTFVQTTLGA
jgi:Tfp pilus assembly protein PilX